MGEDKKKHIKQAILHLLETYSREEKLSLLLNVMDVGPQQTKEILNKLGYDVVTVAGGEDGKDNL